MNPYHIKMDCMWQTIDTVIAKLKESVSDADAFQEPIMRKVRRLLDIDISVRHDVSNSLERTYNKTLRKAALKSLQA